MPVVRGRPRVRVSPCRFCHKTFKRQEHLQRHERIHTHERPFECDCGESFSRQDLLVRHRRLAHASASRDAQVAPAPSPSGRARQVKVAKTTAANGHVEEEEEEEEGDDDDFGNGVSGSDVEDEDAQDDGGDDGSGSRDQDYTEDHGDTPMPDQRRRQLQQQQQQQQQQQHLSAMGQQPHGTTMAIGHHHLPSSSMPPGILDGPELTMDASSSSSYLNTGNPGSLQPAEILIDPMLGVDGSPDLEILWNDMQGFCPSLPNDFFDTDFSITDISQRLAFNKRGEEEEATARTMPALPGIDPMTYVPPEATGSNPDYGIYPPPARDTTSTSTAQQMPPPATASLVSRLPSLEPDSAYAEDDQSNVKRARPDAQSLVPWRVSAETHRRIADACADLHGICLSGFAIPSRHTLARYLEGYFRGFHEHLPFLHGATFSAATASLELVLALAAVGALYRFEHAKGYNLYSAADAIVGWRLGQTKASALDRLSGCSPYYAGLVLSPRNTGDHGQHQQHQQHQQQRNQHPSRATGGGPSATSSSDQTRLGLLQAMIVLMALSSWGDRSMVPESLAMSSHVSVLAQELGLSRTEADISPVVAPNWSDWVAAEGRRRTLFVAYVLTNLQSVAFNVPPSILNQDVGLLLPASGDEWNASTARLWAHTRVRQQQRQRQRLFQTTLDALIQGTPPHRDGDVSAFGNYLLMHGLVQQIFFARQNVTPRSTGSLSTSFIKRMEDALRAWQESWEATHESTLDPSSPKGPLGFNSTALLRLAHIRLNANVGTRRELVTRDSQRIAAALMDTHQHMVLANDGGGGGNKPTPHLDRAVLQCIHAFSVPVRVGIAYVARTQTLNWSIQHALCNLECAMLLLRWLRAMANAVATRGFDTLYPDQVKLLNMTFTLVRETNLRDDVDADALAHHAHSNAHDQAQAQAKRIRRLAAAVASLWAETFRGFHVFEMVYVIGAAMSTVSDTLNEEIDAEGRW